MSLEGNAMFSIVDEARNQLKVVAIAGRVTTGKVRAISGALYRYALEKFDKQLKKQLMGDIAKHDL